MKKSILILGVLLSTAGWSVHAEEGLMDAEGTSLGSSGAPQSPPLLLAQGLPGSPAPASSWNTVPALLITDLTNVPNPFDSRAGGVLGRTEISYQLAQDAHVSVTLYDLLGKEVRSWEFAAGASGGRQGLNALTWDGTRSSGQKVSKGGYIAEMVVETPHAIVTAARKIGVIH